MGTPGAKTGPGPRGSSSGQPQGAGMRIWDLGRASGPELGSCGGKRGGNGGRKGRNRERRVGIGGIGQEWGKRAGMGCCGGKEAPRECGRGLLAAPLGWGSVCASLPGIQKDPEKQLRAKNSFPKAEFRGMKPAEPPGISAQGSWDL